MVFGLAAAGSPAPLLAQQQPEFGKNIVPRLVPNPKRWYYFNSKHFETHFYDKNKPLAELAVRYAEDAYQQLRRGLDARADTRFALYVYSNPLDYQYAQLPQQDVVLEEMQNINRLSVYFNGNQADFYRQIRSQLVHARLRELFYGGNTSSNLQSRLLLNLPDWYLTGATQYLGEEWLPEDEAFMRSLDKRSERFFEALTSIDYTPENAKLQKSFWYFVDQVYGRKKLFEVLYMTRLTRSVESGFRTMLGTTLDNLTTRWMDWVLAAFPNERQTVQPAELVGYDIPASHRLVNSAVSPDGKRLALLSEHMGRYQLFLHDLTTGTTSGPRIQFGDATDKREPRNWTFPIAWNPNGQELALFGTQDTWPVLLYLNTETRRVQRVPLRNELDWVNHISYSRDGARVLLSAVRNGQTDLYLTAPASSSFAQLTNTPYDELWPAFGPDNTSLYFTSNGGDLLGGRDPVVFSQTQRGYDIFRLPLPVGAARPARLTFVPYANTAELRVIGSQLFYRTDVNGLPNLASINLAANNAEETFLTNVNTGVLHYSVTGNQVFAVTFQDRRHRVATLSAAAAAPQRDIRKTPAATVRENAYLNALLEQARAAERAAAQRAADSLRAAGIDTVVVDPAPAAAADSVAPPLRPAPRRRFYVFDEADTSTTATRKEPADNNAGTRLNRKLRARLYSAAEPYNIDSVETSKLRVPKLGFNLLQIRSDINLDPVFRDQTLSNLFNNLTGVDDNVDFAGPFLGLNFTTELQVSDPRLYHQFRGGFTVFTDFTSNDIYADYRFAKYRPYLEVGIRRSSRLIQFIASETRYIAVVPRVGVFYPLSRFLRVGVEGEYLSIVTRDLNPVRTRNTDGDDDLVGARFSATWDNVRAKGSNYFVDGFQARLHGEMYFSRDRGTYDYPRIGLEARAYRRVLGDIVLAARLDAGFSRTSRGQQFYVGGVDNWINTDFTGFGRVQEALSNNEPETFYFQRIEGGVRGFAYGTRVGSRFGVFNAELRIPLLALSSTSLSSRSQYNFQLVAFYDAGMTWDEGNPFTDLQRTLVREVIRSPLQVDVFQLKTAYIQSAGAGLRINLFNLPFKADLAWPIEQGQDSRLQFVIGIGRSF